MSAGPVRWPLLRTALLAGLLAAGALLASRGGLKPQLLSAAARLQGAGWPGAALYGLAYLPASLLMLPASPLTLGAGFVFGWGPGLVVGALGSTLGATGALLAGRTLGRPLALRLVRAVPRFEAIARAVERRGFEVVALLRVTPLVPFPVLNYLLGLTRLPARRFALATLLGMLPGNVLYAYLGASAPRLAEALATPSLPGPAGVVLGLGVLALTAGLVWLAGRVLARELEAPGPPAEEP
jgi:uncharacterized membrane protein YdjX (TVP38/TMEM64 family)